jgi:hypothetical protein
VQEWIGEARWRAEHGDELSRVGGAPAGAATPAAGTGAADSGTPLVQGTVSLPAGAGAPGGALFVIARKAGTAGGPPLAVKRIESPRFPVAYAIGPEDAMIPGRPVDGPFEVVARLSRSGAAGPARPGDLEGRPAAAVASGARGVDIVLAPVAAGADGAPGPR